MNLEVFGDSMVMLGELKGEGEDFMPIKGFIDDSVRKKYNLLDKIMDQSLRMTGLLLVI